MSRLTIHLLGSPRIERDGESIQIGRNKAVALLAYLAVTARSHRRDALATLLWPEFDQRGARAELRRALSVLNRRLGSDLLDTDPESSGLNPAADVWLDVAEFRRLLAACDAHAHDHTLAEACAECVARLQTAAELYHDDFMSGFTLPDAPGFDEWQRFQAGDLLDELASAFERLVGCQGAEGDVESAIAYARRWLALDPLQEPAHRALMELYVEAGRRSAALRQYRACVRVLEQELGVQPSAETTALYERIQAEPSRPTVATVTTPSPQRTDAPPPAFLEDEDAPAHFERPVFVARGAELAQLLRYLETMRNGQGSVVFVTGGTGRGKTSLMAEFAQRAMAAHPDLLVASGSCHAYSGVGDPYLPFREILAMLSGDVEARWAAGTITREHAQRLWAAFPLAIQALLEHGPYLIDALVPGPPLLSRATAAAPDDAERLAQLRGWVEREKGEGSDLGQSALFHQFANVLFALAAQHPLLLTLDDLQWVDSGSVGMLFHLGQRLASAGTRVLIVGAYRPEEVALGRPSTSSGERERHLLDETLAEFQRRFGDVWVDLAHTDAVEGRRLVDALLDTEPNRLDDGFRRELTGHTGGHPLFTVELLRAMQERGDLVQDAGGRWIVGPTLDWGQLPARVEAVIRARVDRLDEQLREMLAVASVEGEDFTAQVLAQVQDLPERALLATLSRELGPLGHRLVREAGEVKIGERFLSRYQFAHTLFQSYLYHTLSAGERRLLHAEIGAALEVVYAGQIQEVAVPLAHHYSEAGQRIKAIEYSVRAADQARVAYASDEAMAYYQKALRLLGPSEALPIGTREDEWRLAALKGLGQVCHGIGEFVEAERHLREALALGEKLSLAPPALARLYFWLGEALVNQNMFDEMIELGEAGLALLVGEAASYAESTDAALMYDLVLTGHFVKGNQERASEFTYQTAGFLQRLPFTEELAHVYDHLITRYLLDKHVEEAAECLDTYERMTVAHHDMRALAHVHFSAGLLLGLTGDLWGGVSRNEQAAELCRRIGDTTQRIWSLMQLGTLFLSLGDLPQAEAYSRAEEAIGIYSLAAWAYRCTGQIYLAHGAWEAAVGTFQQAHQLEREADDHWDQAWCARHLGQAHLASGNRREAFRRFQEALTLAAPEAAQGGSRDSIIPSGPESVRQTLHLFASALAGLEEASQDPGAFRALCRSLSDEYPGFRDLGFVNWYAEPVKSRDHAKDLFYDAFARTLADDWVMQDPFGDCSMAVQDGLTINAANGRDLVHINLSAPRILRPISYVGDFAVQTACAPVSKDRPSIGGLLLWKDKENYLRLDRGYRGVHEIGFQGCLENKDVIIGRGRVPSDHVFLRLERVGARVNALCSSDGKEWFTVGHIEFPVEDTIQVGLHAIGNIDRTIYHGAYPDGSAMQFESFTLWQVAL